MAPPPPSVPQPATANLPRNNNQAASTSTLSISHPPHSLPHSAVPQSISQPNVVWYYPYHQSYRSSLPAAQRHACPPTNPTTTQPSSSSSSAPVPSTSVPPTATPSRPTKRTLETTTPTVTRASKRSRAAPPNQQASSKSQEPAVYGVGPIISPLRPGLPPSTSTSTIAKSQPSDFNTVSETHGASFNPAKKGSLAPAVWFFFRALNGKGEQEPIPPNEPILQAKPKSTHKAAYFILWHTG
ncbi:hypothetical protein FRC02_009545, partial [Tulasnella sp. 418]